MGPGDTMVFAQAFTAREVVSHDVIHDAVFDIVPSVRMGLLRRVGAELAVFLAADKRPRVARVEAVEGHLAGGDVVIEAIAWVGDCGHDGCPAGYEGGRG